MSKKEHSENWRGLAGGSILGAFIALALSALLVLLLALIVSSGKAAQSSQKAITVASAFIGTAVGAFVARRKNGRAAFISGVATALIAIVVRLIIMLISDESTALDSVDIAICVSMLCGGMAVGVIAPRRKRRKR